MQDLTLVMAQLDPLVGDVAGNTAAAIEAVREARLEHGADVVVFSELFLTGYPPEDLLLREAMESRLQEALAEMARKIDRIAPETLVIIGYPGMRQGARRNLAGVLLGGQWCGEYAKQALPNYQVFDEDRYFEPGNEPLVIEHRGAR
ncbi:MAG: nitrilase-related carbon-nitrogen hydrolase, partial [Pseudomonadota bacterium]|nr:nitrilase-related carbon-nitrogen hydrolase [Pseudomonadota bacterium]